MNTIQIRLGKVAYDTYCDTRDWISFNGDPLPKWDSVRGDIQKGWILAAIAVSEECRKILNESLEAHLKMEITDGTKQLSHIRNRHGC